MSVSAPLAQSVLLGDAIENAPLLILVADEEMRYVAANRFACEVLGYTREELLELRVTDVARYEGAAAEFAHLRDAGALNGRKTGGREDGSELSYDYRATDTETAVLAYAVAIGWPGSAC